LKYIILVVGAGILAGTQIYNPHKRVIEAMAGSALIFVMWNISTISALWFMIIMYPFPFGMHYGNSNFVFMLIIVIIFLIRVSSGQEKFHLDRTLALPVGLLVLAYIFSFKNVPLGTNITRLAIINTANFLSAAALTFLMINFVDDVSKLKKAVRLLLISGTLIIAFNIMELLFPGRVIVPGWLQTQYVRGLVLKGVRIGGPFRDFELNAEFLTLNSFIIFFMIIRTRRMLTRSFLSIILLIDLLLMFATVTRGALIALIVGVIYLMIISRKDLTVAKVIYFMVAFVVVIFVLEKFVAQYTFSGSVFERMVTVTFEKGFIPDSRTGPWEDAINRGMENPIFGIGPAWDFGSGHTTGFWPHNLYLFYFNTLGIVGLLAFLFLLFRIVKATIPGIKSSLVKSPFPEAFMKILHVMIIIFMLDEIKIEYLRNKIYLFFVWILFALIIITRNIIDKDKSEREDLVQS
ncbi:MAG: hypothetical protein GF417_05100, partial [Candidatus Latescibacteria bacterium]|nr:hypothetical protein [Candidatus Latescibacterota bacterium]